MLSSPGYRSGASGRRVIVKARIVKLGAKGLANATAHLRYLQRDGTTREGERGELYGPGDEPVDGKAFVERGSGDAKHAVIERSRDFTLVPWRPVLERAVGKPVSGIMRASGISWTIGRGQSGPSIDI